LKTDLLTLLLQYLKGVKKIVILGIGSELMQDDAAGVIVTQALLKKYGDSNSKFKIVCGYNAPENFSSIIADFHPDHIIIIDAADLKQLPGTIHNVPVKAINDYTLGTHKISLIIMIRYLKEVINCDFTVLAVQYKSIEFNAKMTKEVKSGVKKVISLLSEILDKNYVIAET
jgi:hydrogenase 3 maturation protease